MLTSLMNATNRTQRIVALVFAVVMVAGLAVVIQMAVTSLYSGLHGNRREESLARQA